MRDSRITATVALAVTLGASASIYFSVWGGFGPGIDRASHEASGSMLAQQALSLLKSGGEITVITRDTSTFKNPASDIQLESFRKQLRAARAPIHSILALQVDPLRPVQVPPGDFFELIRHTPQGGVIVSFMGPPLLSEAQRLQLGKLKPAIVAFCPGTMPSVLDLNALFRQGLLDVAVVETTSLAGSLREGATRSGNSGHSFAAISRANLAELERWRRP